MRKKKKVLHKRNDRTWLHRPYVGYFLFFLFIVFFVLLSIFSSSIKVLGASTTTTTRVSCKFADISCYLRSFFTKKAPSTTTTTTQKTTSITPSQTTTATINVHALSLGDNKYSTSPKKGYIYLCRTQSDGGGAFTAGPWIDQTAKTWDLTKKVTVDGAVVWTNSFQVSKDGSTRSITGNGLPSHNTGVYPIATTDDAYQYDRNPNSITTQTVSLQLPTNPTLLAIPKCVGGEVGIMLSGIPLFNGFDAGNRDAAAWEVQDACSGHPQVSGQYHYHSYSTCITNASETYTDGHSAIMGYALDGFGIYGLKGEGGITLSTNDLDECHGHTHTILWDKESKTMYHYHMTQDFPYSVSCFRGKRVGDLRSTSGTMQGMQKGSDAQGTRPSGMPPRPPKGMFPPR